MHKRVALLVLATALVSLAATSPETREITDPKKIASAEVSGAGAVPIDDLFYTRNTGGGAWSPDGKEIVFTSNFTGRFNLWKVSSSGGWPIQLSQSDNRQADAVWSPDGKWILSQTGHTSPLPRCPIDIGSTFRPMRSGRRTESGSYINRTSGERRRMTCLRFRAG